ncbi:MAG: Txe/YoeB family addiction module toxin [Leptospiraceae bacterium]|nr:Txe/YoeB family addiction module toxin [Leptospiraceae bacterium]
MKNLVFEPEAFDELKEWIEHDKKIALKILELIQEIQRTPYKGKGKPEALKHEYSGYWSRRINLEHRLIYKVTEEEILIIACKYHYS